MSVTATSLYEFLEQELDVDPADIELDSGLFTEGILDSFSITNLVVFIEQQASIRVTPSELNLDNLDSIDKILKFVNSK